MKLGELRSIIRGRKDGIWVESFGLTVLVQKGSLLDALGQRFESKSTETGLTIDDDGVVRSTIEPKPTSHVGTDGCVRSTPAAQIDLEDYLADTADDLDDLI